MRNCPSSNKSLKRRPLFARLRAPFNVTRSHTGPQSDPLTQPAIPRSLKPKKSRGVSLCLSHTRIYKHTHAPWSAAFWRRPIGSCPGGVRSSTRAPSTRSHLPCPYDPFFCRLTLAPAARLRLRVSSPPLSLLEDPTRLADSSSLSLCPPRPPRPRRSPSPSQPE